MKKIGEGIERGIQHKGGRRSSAYPCIALHVMLCYVILPVVVVVVVVLRYVFGFVFPFIHSLLLLLLHYF